MKYVKPKLYRVDLYPEQTVGGGCKNTNSTVEDSKAGPFVCDDGMGTTCPDSALDS